jgi:hypothetical protein
MTMPIVKFTFISHTLDVLSQQTSKKDKPMGLLQMKFNPGDQSSRKHKEGVVAVEWICGNSK